jgi:hypothetical protein
MRAVRQTLVSTLSSGAFSPLQPSASACQFAASLRSAALSPQLVVPDRRPERRTRPPQVEVTHALHSATRMGEAES